MLRRAKLTIFLNKIPIFAMKIDKFLQTVGIIAILTGFLTACGQKGPLYLPKHKQTDDVYMEMPQKEKNESAEGVDIFGNDENSKNEIYKEMGNHEGNNDENDEEQTTDDDKPLFLP